MPDSSSCFLLIHLPYRCTDRWSEYNIAILNYLGENLYHCITEHATHRLRRDLTLVKLCHEMTGKIDPWVNQMAYEIADAGTSKWPDGARLEASDFKELLGGECEGHTSPD